MSTGTHRFGSLTGKDGYSPSITKHASPSGAWGDFKIKHEKRRTAIDVDRVRELREEGLDGRMIATRLSKEIGLAPATIYNRIIRSASLGEAAGIARR